MWNENCITGVRGMLPLTKQIDSCGWEIIEFCELQIEEPILSACSACNVKKHQVKVNVALFFI